MLLIREAKTLDPFLRKLRGRRSVEFDYRLHRGVVQNANVFLK